MDSEAAGACCPKCSSALSITRLEGEGDTRRETVYFINCPWCDLNMSVTDQQVVDVVMRMVLERLQCGEA